VSLYARYIWSAAPIMHCTSMFGYKKVGWKVSKRWRRTSMILSMPMSALEIVDIIQQQFPILNRNIDTVR